MGFFSEIASEARRNMSQRQDPTPALRIDIRPPIALKPAPGPEDPPDPLPSAPAPTAIPEPELATAPADAHIEAEPESAAPPMPSGTSPSEPPSIDLSADADAADEDERKRKHEEAEAKRKAEFDTRQAKKRAARQERLDKIKAMNDAELLAESVKRVAADTERLTRRNMKEAIAEHIQAKCRNDAAFARLVMDPDKSMISCFQYITRKAREYAEKEMKDLGLERTGTYGCDVPDALCFQWAEDYFNDPDAKEDHKDEEKFTPKPYVPNRKVPQKTAKAKKKSQKKSAADKPKAQEKPKTPELEQMSLI